MWQDVVIAVGSMCFSIALVPALRAGSDKPPIFTAAFTAFWLLIYVVVFASLSLWFAAITAGVNGILWTAIGWKKHYENSLQRDSA